MIISNQSSIRSQQLITGIFNDRQFINALYDNAQGSFKDYLMRFFIAENDNGVMSISELRRNVTSSDYDLFKKVLSKYSSSLLVDDEGSLRLEKAKQMAGMNKQNLLNSIISIVIAATSQSVSNYLGTSLKSEYQYAMNFQENEAIHTKHKTSRRYSNAEINAQANKILAAKNYGLTVGQRVWIKNDKLAGQVNNAVNEGLMRGITNDYMNDKLFKPFTNSPKSATTAFNKTKNFYKNQLISQEKNRFGTEAASDVFDRYNVKMLNWNLASTHSHSDACDDLAQGSPYTRVDYPNMPHWGCVCFPSPAYETK